MRKLGTIAINKIVVVTKNTVLGRVTTNRPMRCQIDVVTRFGWLATILFGQKANRDIKTMAAGRTVTATISIMVTVMANIGPIVLNDPSIEKIKRNMATTVVIDEPNIDGPTLFIADVIAKNLSLEVISSSRYLDTMKRT